MKFLPKPNIESPVQRYTGVAKLENYIYDTKQSLVDNLPALTANNIRNLSHKQQEALNKMQRLRHVITVKPADKKPRHRNNEHRRLHHPMYGTSN